MGTLLCGFAGPHDSQAKAYWQRYEAMGRTIHPGGKFFGASVEISAQNYFNKIVHDDQTFTTQESVSRYRRALIVDDVTPTVRYFKSMFML